MSINISHRFIFCLLIPITCRQANIAFNVRHIPLRLRVSLTSLRAAGDISEITVIVTASPCLITRRG